MKTYIYLLILIFVTSCSNYKEVYWCGDHACADNKEKEAYFKKTMIVEVRNLDKNSNDGISQNAKILNQGKSNKKRNIISDAELKEEINIEEQIEIQEKEIAIREQELEEQIEMQEKEMAKKEKEQKQENNPPEDEKVSLNEDSSSTFAKVVENNDIKSKNFDELVEKILIRNSTRSFPKINDIPK